MLIIFVFIHKNLGAKRGLPRFLYLTGPAVTADSSFCAHSKQKASDALRAPGGVEALTLSGVSPGKVIACHATYHLCRPSPVGTRFSMPSAAGDSFPGREPDEHRETIGREQAGETMKGGRGCRLSLVATPATSQDRTSAMHDVSFLPVPVPAIIYIILGISVLLVACGLRAICVTHVTGIPYVHLSYMQSISHMLYISHISYLSHMSYMFHLY